MKIYIVEGVTYMGSEIIYAGLSIDKALKAKPSKEWMKDSQICYSTWEEDKKIGDELIKD